ncbi:MAG: hypothetical protein FWD68_15005 [Alphaproteobacteria bacterium]|nr:hypothetical protein [Alphaproteobacteria bacterium]
MVIHLPPITALKTGHGQSFQKYNCRSKSHMLAKSGGPGSGSGSGIDTIGRLVMQPADFVG